MNIEKTMVILVGLPRSGKSTIIEENYKECIRVSRDELRKAMLFTKGNHSREELITEVFDSMLLKSLKTGASIVIDNTSLKYKYRNVFYGLAKRFGYNVVLHDIKCSMEELYRRCDLTGFPKDVVLRMGTSMDIINIDSDDFGRLRELRVPYEYVKTITSDSEPFHEKMKDFDQNNPHHKYTLDIHLKKSGEYVANNYHSRIVGYATRNHDVGKLYTKRLHKNGEHSCFYGHGELSAYMISHELDSTSYSYNFTDLQKAQVVWLIKAHMKRYGEIGKKGLKKMSLAMRRLEITPEMLKWIWVGDTMGHDETKDKTEALNNIDEIIAKLEYIMR